MVRSPAIAREKWHLVQKSYQSGLSMQQVADRYFVTIDVITYILRHTKTPRRTFSEAGNVAFSHKAPSFTVRERRSKIAGEIDLIGAMLYWAEGYKRVAATGIDFANSDPRMAKIFMYFLRTRYRLDESRLRIQLFCYSDQDRNALVTYWSELLRVPKTQFQKTYVREAAGSNGRKVPYGVAHIRYNDKKLLMDVLKLLQSVMQRFGVSEST